MSRSVTIPSAGNGGSFTYTADEVKGNFTSPWNDSVGRNMNYLVPPKVSGFSAKQDKFFDSVKQYASMDVMKFSYSSLRDEIEKLEAK